MMYFHEPGEATATLPPPSVGLQTALWASAVGTLALGIFPSWLLDFANKSANFR
jgi:NADH-quinone oxidoreductase subunit N